MPKRNKQYMAERRDEILDATMRCLSRSGLAGLSTTDICTQAGISMGALYTHFGSKDEILQALVERSTQTRNEKLVFADFAALRRHFLRRIDELVAEKNRGICRADLSLIIGGTDEQIAKMLRPMRDTRALANAIRALKVAGEVRRDVDPEAAATALDAITWGALVLALIGGRPAAVYRASLLVLLDSLI
jgi:AcrR family transcriptional regulator